MTLSKRATLFTSTVAVLVLPLGGQAYSQSTQIQSAPTRAAQNCPAGYNLVAGFCQSPVNGDVVLATASSVPATRAIAQCKAGYDIMINALCIHGKSGDVVYADMLTIIQAANK